ncbi:LysR substrate-binding domain-containing protein [Paragemmobacter straminiformis]|uniref:LysR family transcriptional regulator n=1 Tax=Paragemmobacter straminiformis TaxID=2045119 RepID=A0A842IBA4_9RHOB|nr:LysR substrate-binding domain-containing protein [Gemmobacter straminiformis]MBC2836901.1 LysR family transcriptional regulator [Gemmobacter straminiformis]
MNAASHLKSLQALEMALRLGSLSAAAGRLGITPAAVGQRVRALELYLGTDLLLRGRSGLQPTPELSMALGDLASAFAALDRVTETLDFQRVTEIHIVADPDWTELWLMPRLARFRAAHPNIRFCINGAGDVPMRLGAPDCRITYGPATGSGEELYRDRLLPVTGPDNLRRMADWDAQMPLEGMPLLHLEAQRDNPDCPGWPEWIDRFGHRRQGTGRGVHYRHARLALEAVRLNVGFLVCGLSLVADDLAQGRIVLPYPVDQNLAAPLPYVLTIAPHATHRPQFARFADWLRAEAAETRQTLGTATPSGAA